jgi:AraC-like DNA-binding protein
MRMSERWVVLHHRDPVLAECISRIAAGGGVKVVLVDGWEALIEVVAGCQAPSVLVVDPYAGSKRGTGFSPAMQGLLTRFPSQPIIAAVYPESGSLDDLRRLGEIGVAQVIDLSEERTAPLVRARLETAWARPLQNLISTALPVRTSGYARSIVETAARVTVEGGAGEQLASRLFITPRTLTRWCRRTALPAPRRLLGWMRALLASALLDDPGRTIEAVAGASGYASHTSLRQALRNLLGRTPSQLRQAGAFDYTLHELHKDFRVARSPKATYRRSSSE